MNALQANQQQEADLRAVLEDDLAVLKDEGQERLRTMQERVEEGWSLNRSRYADRTGRCAVMPSSVVGT